MRYVLAAAVFIAAMAFDAPAMRGPMAMRPGARCVDVGWGDVVWDCQYRTFEACRAERAGRQSRLLQPEPGL